jgi:hypothetical protein
MDNKTDRRDLYCMLCICYTQRALASDPNGTIYYPPAKRSRGKQWVQVGHSPIYLVTQRVRVPRTSAGFARKSYR